MNDKDPVFYETVQLICLNFEESKTDLFNKKDLHSFQESLARVVRHLLYHNYSQLINILYKIDVDEKKYLALFKDLPSDEISHALATLIIERAKEKAVLRQKYKKG